MSMRTWCTEDAPPWKDYYDFERQPGQTLEQLAESTFGGPTKVDGSDPLVLRDYLLVLETMGVPIESHWEICVLDSNGNRKICATHPNWEEWLRAEKILHEKSLAPKI